MLRISFRESKLVMCEGCQLVLGSHLGKVRYSSGGAVAHLGGVAVAVHLQLVLVLT